MKIMDDKSIRSALVTTPQPAAGWDDLVKNGLAVRGTPTASMVGFCLTDDGARAVLLPGEKLDPEDFPAALAQSEEKK